jgi:CheY-like chemotaxis protein
LHELFTACQTIITPKAEEKGLRLYFYAEPTIGKKLLGDPIRLRQVTLNLLDNAVKFTHTGMIKFKAIVKELHNGNITINFEIKDSGIGMTEEQIKKIFNPFIQAETGMTRKYGGTGLGLTISKSIVELMGGTLFVESVPKIGSKFSFELTFNTIISDEVLEEKQELHELEKPIFDGEVLLCEDNSMNQQVICEHLEKVGIKTFIAENGKIGVNMFQDRMKKLKSGIKQFDLIFMDVHMPIMDGLEAAAKIMKLNKEIPIVAITANIMPSDMQMYKESGMIDCLGKPFSSNELWRCLMKYLKPIRWQNANENIEAESEFMHRLIDDFIKSNQTRIAEIRLAIKTGDIKLAHRMAHSLKSNAGHLGKTHLQQAAADVEYRLQNNNNLVTEEHLNILEKELNETLMQFSQELDNEPLHHEWQEESSQIDVQELPELFTQLEPLLEMGSPDSRKLINKIRCIPGSEVLIQQIKDLDFDKAIISLAELKKNTVIQ